jgi:hypothetical protein
MPVYPYYLLLLGLCFVASLSIYFTRNTGFLKFFAPFLLVTFSVEFIGDILSRKNIYNGLLYNIFALIEVPFFLLYIRSVTRNQQVKTIIPYCIGAFILVNLAYLFLLRANVFHYIAYNLGALMIVAFGGRVFYENYRVRMQPGRISIPDQLICFGLVIFFGGSFPIYTIFEVYKLPSVSFVFACRDILYILNFIMYSSFLVAFIYRLVTRKRIA